MSTRNLIIAVATIVVIVAAWKITQQKAPTREIVIDRLYPELIDKLNDANRLAVKSNSKTTELVKVDKSWVVGNRDNFPADFSAIKSTLLSLAATKVVEEKTSKAENYAQLGLAGIEQDDSESTLVQVEDATGGELASLLIGNERISSKLETPNYYARKSDTAAALLVEGNLDISGDPEEWMDTDVVNIDTKRVRKVTINQAGGTPIVISKDAHIDNFFTLHEIPIGFDAKSRSVVSSLGALLLNLKFDDVAATTKLDGLAPRIIAELETFDGLVATVEEFDYEEKAYVRLRFEFDSDIVIEAPVVPEGVAAVLDDLNKKDTAEDKESEEKASVADEVAALNTKVTDWAYVLPDYKSRLLGKKFDDLIKPEEAPTKDGKKAKSE